MYTAQEKQEEMKKNILQKVQMRQKRKDLQKSRLEE